MIEYECQEKRGLHRTRANWTYVGVGVGGGQGSVG